MDDFEDDIAIEQQLALEAQLALEDQFSLQESGGVAASTFSEHGCIECGYASLDQLLLKQFDVRGRLASLRFFSVDFTVISPHVVCRSCSRIKGSKYQLITKTTCITDFLLKDEV